MVGTQSSSNFEKAAVEVKKLTKEPSSEEQLKLYALFKIGKGAPIEGATAPSMFDIRGKYKYQAWKEMAEKGVKPEEARQEYVQFVEELKPRYEYDPTKVPRK